jgi:hypothetical protein
MRRSAVLSVHSWTELHKLVRGKVRGLPSYAGAFYV